jgi:hypothetical protein
MVSFKVKRLHSMDAADPLHLLTRQVPVPMLLQEVFLGQVQHWQLYKGRRLR